MDNRLLGRGSWEVQDKWPYIWTGQQLRGFWGGTDKSKRKTGKANQKGKKTTRRIQTIPKPRADQKYDVPRDRIPLV